MKKATILKIILIALTALALTSIAADGGRKFETTLTGAQEVNGGDPDGSGTAEITLNPGQGEVCFELTATGTSMPVAAHIHAAPAGEWSSCGAPHRSDGRLLK